MHYLSRVIKGAQIGEGGSCHLEVRRQASRPGLLKEKQEEDRGNNQEVDLMAEIDGLKEQARQSLGAARLEAQGIVKAAREEALQIKDNARQEGFRQGYEECLEKAREDAQRIKGEAQAMFEEGKRVREDIIRGMEQEITELSTDIAQKIVSKQLDINPETVLNIAMEAIGMATGRVMVKIYVNPGQRDMFNKKRGELAGLLSDRGLLYIIPDSDVQPGGCIIETDNGKIDATLDSRWEEVVKALGPELADA